MFKEEKNGVSIYGNLLNGNWVVKDSTKLIEIKSPANEQIVGFVEAMSKEAVDEAISVAKDAQKKWKEVPTNQKSRLLHNVADLLEERIEEMADIMVLEISKDRKSCMSEIKRTADLIRFTADTAENIKGESIPGDSFPGFKNDKISIVTREPLGVVLAISPFNYPVNLAGSKIAPALMAGNTVVFKPATQGSICGLYLAKAFNEAGIPSGVLNTITGKGSEIGDYVVTHKDIDFVNFTGSSEVGRRISKITEMKPLLMELGGKDAAIVLEDADLDLAAKNIVAGAFSYSGQRCTAVKRVLVMESVADELSSKVLKEMDKVTVGNPLDGDFTVGPLISSKACDFVQGIINDAEKKGAKLLLGGTREGNIIMPTLFDNVTVDMRIAWEEPFGPVLPIIRVKTIDEAIKIANESEYGLQSSVFTRDINEAFYVANRLEVGTVQVNNKTERGPDHFPFLGVKSSGMGTQGVAYSIEAMSRPKATVINLK
ncbi:NADP-dependent glyceraldehyde-3-phosphate dehydrogenase [Clostridium sardiniense]|uniref:NADP-dependent glyceraldehyde-3-phosphate dehydrogenase n=1 Tax=Clostridium sardiniense TaxID=29369 RepID=A0ABS7KV47_CLOSR|nr:NADP-dependent glyceraldehyde-3-phosphate dehydrogenase [Clostridium sardiniense]MBY0754688.1 NADP-dependent glyceraldehyde-3-phosphate dehydrogenase [Clostridium sardiniense]MDQ0460592.1 glyceraldehyde-3-phosphate dehydrogenase (NADP+) [Clostridium sardiniense]